MKYIYQQKKRIYLYTYFPDHTSLYFISLYNILRWLMNVHLYCKNDTIKGYLKKSIVYIYI